MAVRCEVTEEMFLIGREALAKAFRHAYATEIDLKIEYGRKQLCLSCRDNGVGFKQAVLNESGDGGHWA